MISTGFRPRQRHTYRNHKNCTPGVTRGPMFNAGESKEAYHIELAIPGWSREDISIESKEGHLVVTGKAPEKKDNDIRFHRRMFSLTDFEKSFIIPEDVDNDKISAKFDSGILYITLNKDEEKITPRSIEIK